MSFAWTLVKFSFLTYVCVKNSGRGAKNCVHDHMLPDFLVSYSAPANTPLANRIFQPINTKRILTTEIRCNRHPYSLFPSLAGPRIMGPRTRMHDRSCGIDNSEFLHSYICRQVDCGTFEFGGKTPGFNTVKDLWGKLMLSFLFAGKFPCHSAWFLGRDISCRRRGLFIFY